MIEQYYPGSNHDRSGFGLLSEVATFSRKHIFGYWPLQLLRWLSRLLVFLFGDIICLFPVRLLWQIWYSLLFRFLVGIPTGIKMFNWTATFYKGSIKLSSPLLYVFGFFFLFLVGGLTGIALSTLPIDIYLHDTYYVVAHFHFTMVGGMLMAFLAGIHYWWPKITGKLYKETLAKTACVTVLIGFNVTFLPQFVMGAQGMPRRYFNYIEQFQSFHQVSTIGAYILGLGI